MPQNRRTFIGFIAKGAAVTATGALATACTASPSKDATPWASVAEIRGRIEPPVFPDHDFQITAYGAVGDGIQDCSDAISRAITACSAAGGGRVVVPAGRYATGPIHLDNNVNLHVMGGATLAFSTDPNRYMPAVFTRWQGIECFNYSPCIYAFGKNNIAITGEGTLDGQATNENWWRWSGIEKFGWVPDSPVQKTAFHRLEELSEKEVPVEQRMFGNGDALRPMMVQPYRCTNVLIEGVTIRRSPMWVVHPVLCTNVTVRAVTVDSHGPNNDGCNPESCTDVLIEACTFDTGDDCVAIKSGRNSDGRRVATPATNIVISDCRMRDGHGAATIGSEVSGGVHHVFIEKCSLESPNLLWALRFKSNAARGGVVEHIYARDITVTKAREAAVTVDFQYDEGAEGSHYPVVRHVEISNMRSLRSERVLELLGIPGATIQDVVIRNSTFDNVTASSTIEEAADILLSDVRVNGRLISTVADLTSN